ncbi:phospholipase D family protein [Falsirhodobacter xinxiangensis]|uniref:phospholipase D family protein n=1 Tax=Falsirhodobacter xinxiangensis TaxID=2530049 RepID=UPI0010A9996F|nr:phospholipase D family protein [Rhodobacter xinxiangensis]
MRRKLLLAISLTGLAYLVLRSRLPERHQGDEPEAPGVERDSLLASSSNRAAQGRAGQSGIHLLSDPHDAFAARMLLVQQATRTLDLQYYIWHGDRTGTLLLNAVLEAADRGVRVRLLLDDNGIPGLDAVLSALDAHPLISIRIFNPFGLRFPKALGFLLDFPRLNRRMHNKSLTADRAATIVGGRNVGDEYFGSGNGGVFEDLDVLAIGTVVDDVCRDFERYWTCGSSYPAGQVLSKGRPRMLAKLRRAASRVAAEKDGRRFLEDVRRLPVIKQLLDGDLELEWAEVTLISDDPAKGLGKADHTGLLAGQLAKAIGRPLNKLGLISGYFVPGPAGVRQLAALSRAGVEISILTNSYRSGDVKLVHAGYAPYRKALLRAGVRLFELKADRHSNVDSKSGTRRGIGNRLRGTGTGSTAALRSGATTLHAKTITIDDERLFVGSFNLDPRSWQLNCEMGFLIESPMLAKQVARVFETKVPQVAYRVRLSGELSWHEKGEVEAQVHKHEPGVRWWDRMMREAAARLPIRWLL